MPDTDADAEVRAARPEDAEAVLGILCVAFGLDCDAARPFFYQDPYYDLSHKRVLATPEDGIVSCLTIIPSTLTLGGRPVAVGGLAGVATLPEHQNRGYATRLLSETIRVLADEMDYPLSALFPYHARYYRGLGWETASGAVCWSGTLPDTDNAHLAAHVRPLSPQMPESGKVLRRLHALAPADETGLCRRDERRWHVLEMLTQTWEWYVYDDNAEAEGYVALERPAQAGDPVRVHEMLAVSDAARQGLRAFVASFCGPEIPFSWITNSRQLQAFAMPPGDDFIRPAPGMMLRLTSLADALHHLHPAFAPVLAQAKRAVTIYARDAQRPENNAPLMLCDAGIVAGIAEGGEWLRADIGTLAQFYTGHCLPSDAAANGSLAASSPETLALADAIFPLYAPFIAHADQF